jgi:FtsH-binding integral membrane protein
MSFNEGFYKQRQSNVNTMSVRSYMAAISGFTAVFIMVSMVGASFSYTWTFSDNGWLLLLFMLACLVGSIGGGVLAQANDDPMISVIGGTICAGAMGLMIGPFVALYELGSVVQAFVLAAGVVLVTGFIGALLPADLSAWGAPLFGLLLGAIFIQFGGIMLAAFGLDMELSFTILDWAVLILFCAIMVYDLNMARRLDRTFNNAIDVAVNVFLNFANIFIRILSIMGQAKK